MMASALRLHEAFPKAEIRAFAMFRTLSFVPELERLIDPSVGTITYYEESGKTFRDP